MIERLSENELLTDDGFSAAVLSLLGCDITAILNPTTNRRAFKAKGQVQPSSSSPSSSWGERTTSAGRVLSAVTERYGGLSRPDTAGNTRPKIKSEKR